jgi:Mg2+/Co2+ transporter CorC
MTTFDDKFSRLYLSTKIDHETIKWILDLGFSRIPIAADDTESGSQLIVGILLAKNLLCVQKDGETI